EIGSKVEESIRRVVGCLVKAGREAFSGAVAAGLRSLVQKLVDAAADGLSEIRKAGEALLTGLASEHPALSALRAPLRALVADRIPAFRRNASKCPAKLGQAVTSEGVRKTVDCLVAALR